MLLKFFGGAKDPRAPGISALGQGCVVSPMLDNIYTDDIMRTIFSDGQEGIKIGGFAIE